MRPLSWIAIWSASCAAVLIRLFVAWINGLGRRVIIETGQLKLLLDRSNSPKSALRGRIVIDIHQIILRHGELSTLLLDKTMDADELDDKVSKAYNIPAGTSKNVLQSSLKAIIAGQKLINYIQSLKQTPVDVGDPKHLLFLTSTWRRLRGKLSESTPPIPHEDWKQLGFQGTDPTTDFRGTGLLGALQLAHFASRPLNWHIWNEAQNGPYWYSFAIVSINVTDTVTKLLLKGHLDPILYNRLLQQINLDDDDQKSLDVGMAVLNECHEMILDVFHSCWMAAQPESLMAFNSIYELTLTKIHRRLAAFRDI